MPSENQRILSGGGIMTWTCEIRKQLIPANSCFLNRTGFEGLVELTDHPAGAMDPELAKPGPIVVPDVVIRIFILLLAGDDTTPRSSRSSLGDLALALLRKFPESNRLFDRFEKPIAIP